ncbi:glycosyltransferase family 2 protein [Limnoglobus roseus]|uniref:GT2 family glycosyltransferase n=1 Tax=Limnoglobus roseus TaxID=2598579 RepID=A0A5C1AJM0_9BACT|nr:glycosyltransferase [Limnoglobus roseus]QEL18377.1 GT2 family glycosyltransferase [Limnoglobus roseus]
MDPRLSVLIITYNQEKYIEQTVRSVLVQQTDFLFEIVIGEDCSTDGTRDVLRKLDAEFPGRLRLLFRDKNLGLVPNVIDTYNSCRGDYLATLGGDDYWTDPQKLAKQVAVLDADPGCSICFHPVRIVDAEGRPSGGVYPKDVSHTTGKAEIANTCYVPAVSTLLRKSGLPQLPSWFARLTIDDWPLYFLYAEFGHFVYLDDVMADYRCHAGGWWSSQLGPSRAYNLIRMFTVLDEELTGRSSFDFGQLGRDQLWLAMQEGEEIKASLSWKLLRAILSPFDRLGAASLAKVIKSRRRPQSRTGVADARLAVLRTTGQGRPPG